jgi:hypothetical protein
MSPPRQRKPTAAVAGTERKFSWATQRITELTHDLDKAQKQAKVRCMDALPETAGQDTTWSVSQEIPCSISSLEALQRSWC